MVKEDVYKADYESVTTRILEEQIPYEVSIEAINQIVDSGVFDE